jgi:hypothetical protein
MSDSKVITKVLSDAINVSEHASVVKFTGDRVAGFAESERQNMKSAADEVETSVQSRLSGRPPQGESDTLVAASILFAALNARGGTWGPIAESADPADCQATDANGRILLVQIVRADSGYVWRELAAGGLVETNSQITELVSDLRAAIQKKTERYPLAVRNGLFLGLDANRLPAFILSRVREAAMAQLQTICESAGFCAIWVIGPTPELSYALLERG